MASLQRLSESIEAIEGAQIKPACMSSQMLTRTRPSSLMPGSPQRRSIRSSSRNTVGTPILQVAERLKSWGNLQARLLPPLSAMAEPGAKTATAVKGSKEKPRAKTSIHNNNPLALLAAETKLKNKEKDIERLHQNLQRISRRPSKPAADHDEA